MTSSRCEHDRRVGRNQVAAKVGELLPSDRTLPLKIITVVVEDLFAIVRSEAS